VNPPRHVQELWDSAKVQRKCVDWAFRWLWNQPEVSVVLSGMSSMEQAIEDVALAGSPRAGELVPGEISLYDKVRTEYARLCCTFRITTSERFAANSAGSATANAPKAFP